MERSSSSTMLLTAAFYYLSYKSNPPIGFAHAFSAGASTGKAFDLDSLHSPQWVASSDRHCQHRHATSLFQIAPSIAITDNGHEGETTPMDVHGGALPAASVATSKEDGGGSTASTRRLGAAAEDTVPSTWKQALRRFFLGDVGPPLVVLAICGFLHTRARLPTPFSPAEAAVFAATIVFWWLQEYVFHRVLLHSDVDWPGKAIHRAHHQTDYFHVSIDPPALLLGWLLAAHLALRLALPWHFCLTATAGYALAGLAYEWSHYIVHTRVRPPTVSAAPSSHDGRHFSAQASSAVAAAAGGLFTSMRDNHAKHHMVDDRYWYAFSVPAMDDLCGTNPSVKEARARPEQA